MAGFIINRYADLSIRKLRTNYGEGYSIPQGYLFEVISCPTYFGSMLEREQNSHRQLTELQQREQTLQRQLREVQERDQNSP